LPLFLFIFYLPTPYSLFFLINERIELRRVIAII
jgi:hypothetical protein